MLLSEAIMFCTFLHRKEEDDIVVAVYTDFFEDNFLSLNSTYGQRVYMIKKCY